MSQLCGRGLITRGAVLPSARPSVVFRQTRNCCASPKLTVKGLSRQRNQAVVSRRGLCVVNVAAQEKQSTAVDTKVGSRVWDLGILYQKEGCVGLKGGSGGDKGGKVGGLER